MGSFLRTFLLLAVAAAALGVATPHADAARTVAGPEITWSGGGRNYTNANRPLSSIRWVVVHVTEGSFWGAVTWLKNPRSRASSHYVVSQKGEIVQIVRDTDIAWHAGNYTVNRGSIGVEHEGWTYRRGTITDAQYRSSARLTAWIAKRALMPLDRSHLIGHADVPDPNNPGRKGGFSHHSDPGPYWHWPRYISYVKQYARGIAAPRYKGSAPPRAKQQVAQLAKSVVKRNAAREATGTLRVAATTLRSGQIVSGFVSWRANAAGERIERVDFLVDGRVLHSDRTAPYAFGRDGTWDTTRLPNGFHVLNLRVVAKGGKTAGSTLRVRVENTPFQVQSALASGSQLKGVVDWQANPLGGKADRVEFLVDGRLRHTEREAPFVFEWDTRKDTSGAHTLAIRAVDEEGRVATVQLAVVVANEVKRVLAISAQSLRDGQSVSGTVKWEASVEGSPERVEFHVDGIKRWVEATRPYVFNGDGGRWDTAQEANGTHTLVVRAVYPDGSTQDAPLGVTVANTPRVPASVGGVSLADGAVLAGTVHVVADGNGAPTRVDFLVDGRTRHTEREAPYEWDWDTTREREGAHVVTVRASNRVGGGTRDVAVTVRNRTPEPPVVTALTVAGEEPGTAIDGTEKLVAEVAGKATTVEFWLDGRLVHTERSAPYEWSWDTRRSADGPHVVLVRAAGPDGAAEKSLPLTVSNAAAAPALAKLSLADGDTVTGTTRVTAETTGAVEKVEFWVDGALKRTDTRSPYTFDWDTRAEQDGVRALRVRVVGPGGEVAKAVSVTVANAVPAQPLAVTSTGIADGSEQKGVVELTAKVDGQPARVEFWLDGRLRHTERSAPYEWAWDTRASSDGSHTLVVRAVTDAGAEAQLAAQVTVRNAATTAPAPAPAPTAPAPTPTPTQPAGDPSVAVTGLVEGATVGGIVPLAAQVANVTPRRVEWYVGYRRRYVDRAEPWQFDWDTRVERNREQVVTVRVVAADGRVLQLSVTVVVQN